MARRSNSQTDETPDATVEAPAESTTDTAPQEAAKPEAAPVDLTPFKEAVATVLQSADESTGELTAEQLAPVNEVYRAIDGVKGKNQARGWVEDQMKAAIMGDGDFASLDQNERIQLARSYVAVKDGLSAGSGGGGTKAPADPTEAFVQKVASLRIGLDFVEHNVPEGVSEEWGTKADELVASLAEQVTSYAAWAAKPDTEESPRGDAPEVSPVVRSAFKIAAGKGTSGGGGSSRPAGAPRRSIEKHLAQVFEPLDSGAFLTVNEIAKAASTEYGTDRPSAGAVSAHLFKTKDGQPLKTDTYEGVAEEGKSRGARKL
jgi:hypothetical protein